MSTFCSEEFGILTRIEDLRDEVHRLKAVATAVMTGCDDLHERGKMTNDLEPEGLFAYGPTDPGCCPLCKSNHGSIQRAIVAFSNHGVQAVLVVSTPALRCDLAEAGIDAGDVWEVKKRPDHGLWVWTGKIVVFCYGGTPDSGEDWDVEYRGEWTPLTDEDWGLLRDGGTELSPLMEGV